MVSRKILLVVRTRTEQEESLFVEEKETLLVYVQLIGAMRKSLRIYNHFEIYNFKYQLIFLTFPQSSSSCSEKFSIPLGGQKVGWNLDIDVELFYPNFTDVDQALAGPIMKILNLTSLGMRWTNVHPDF